ncbi:hypothetical protein PF049_00660 [Erythrobacteraceae bacterium WH01K]|nr:hypothetical protein PF049_00660 [Erythrobacteraceae bacterium WH01K]
MLFIVQGTETFPVPAAIEDLVKILVIADFLAPQVVRHGIEFALGFDPRIIALAHVDERAFLLGRERLDNRHRCGLSHKSPFFNKRGINPPEPGQRVKISAFSLHVHSNVQSERLFS